jgi:hypothetical protein
LIRSPAIVEKENETDGNKKENEQVENKQGEGKSGKTNPNLKRRNCND